MDNSAFNKFVKMIGKSIGIGVEAPIQTPLVDTYRRSYPTTIITGSYFPSGSVIGFYPDDITYIEPKKTKIVDKCPYCNQRLYNNETYCSHCGGPCD